MKSTRIFVSLFTFCLLLAGAFAQAATISGTVTDKTNGKPAVGDTVAMLDVQSGMGVVAHAITDARGHYTLDEPGSGPYLIRVTHQGAGYFIAAPMGGGPGDIAVYDVAAKVAGVHIEADVLEAEASNGQLHVDERFFVHNTSSPPTTQWSQRSFSIVLPADATVGDVGAQRPAGLPTSIKVQADGPKGHYSFNFPIQPDEGDKDTMFQVSYTLPYSGDKFTFKSQETLPADNVAILLPKSMSFAAGARSSFHAVNADPGVQTFLAKNVAADQPLEFTVSGDGAIPRDQQSGGQGADQSTAAAANTPGGGIGEPIDTPDPLSKYKWWILGGIGILLTAGAGFLLRKPEVAMAGAAGRTIPVGGVPAYAAPLYAGSAGSAVSSASGSASAAAKNTALLNVLKEELFALESEKIAGTLAPNDYAEQKAALETVLRRALKRS